MKKTEKKYTAAVLAMILAGTMAGCSSDTASKEQTVTETVAAETTASVSTEAAPAVAAVTSGTAETVVTTVSYNTSGILDIMDEFTERDLEQTADLSNAVYYNVSDNSTISITDEGVYVISGTAENCTITVSADDTDKVQIVLDGVSITNDDSPAIYVISADKVFVTTTSTDNTLSVTGTFTADGTTNTDAVIFSKDDLVLNGTGSLTISSTANGVSCKDDLKITGGTYNITSAEDAVEANDSISVADGTFVIKSSKDGMNSGNDDDLTAGYIYIAGGSFTITAADDGIQATTALQIDGGTFTISASEALEATYIQINGGEIDITASDDGINASAKSTAYNIVIEINDGTISISMANGDTDAIDSNGSIYINGGYVDITAQSAFDYIQSGVINGGTVIVNGTQVTQLTNSMMGGMMGGMGGMPSGTAPEGTQDGTAGSAPGSMQGGMPGGNMSGGGMPGGMPGSH